MSRSVRQRPPAILVVLAVLGATVFVLPLIGLLVRTPWSDLVDLVTSDVVADALWLSLSTSVVATVITVILGVCGALRLGRVWARSGRCGCG